MHLVSDGNSVWFPDYLEDSWRCIPCAWEKGREYALKLATLYPDGFSYKLMPANADHNQLRKRINDAGGKGVKLLTLGGKKKAILSDISVDEDMRPLSWGDPEMKEFLIKFLSYEPNWKTRQHKFDLFGKSRREKSEKCEKASPLMRFAIKVEPGKDGKRLKGDELKEALEKLRKQIKESFKRLGCQISAGGYMKLSPLAKRFLNYVREPSFDLEGDYPIPECNFADDDPLKRIRLYLPRGSFKT